MSLTVTGPLKIKRGDRGRGDNRRSGQGRSDNPVQYSSRSATNFIIFVACAIITYFVASTFFPKESDLIVRELASILQLNTNKKNPLPMDPEESQSPLEAKHSLTPPPEPSYSADDKLTYDFVLNSIPSGAEIYINGLNTGKTTPSRISAPEDKPFQITLKLPRFIEYTRSDLTREITGRSFTATLQKALVAYIDIDVKPPRNAIVSVNGITLTGEVLPINKYAIPAGTPIKVRAENPITGESSEEIVRLNEDQRYRVILTLDPKKRTPSQATPQED